MFNNEFIWLFICIAAWTIASNYFSSNLDIEKEKTKQIEIQLKILQINSVNTNTIVLEKK